jgi:hypothetical protein
MLYVFIALAVVLLAGAGAAVGIMAKKAANLGLRLQAAVAELGNVQSQLQASRSQAMLLSRNGEVARAAEARAAELEARDRVLEARSRELEARFRELEAQFVSVAEEDTKKAGWLDAQQQEIDWLRAELEKRPKVSRKTYKVLTLGMKWTGKTSLTLKWANPLTDLGKIEGTKIERYERTVSQVINQDVTTEHVFEVGDWGGEHIVDAQQELIVDEIHGLLIVVDLGGKDAKTVQPERIQEQLREFQPQSLKYFFGPKTVASCKAVVLFINKADLLPGTPADAETQAKKLYSRLIDDLNAYQSQVDIRVLVGSASYGHSTHHLFSHFVEKILPANAYDNQLLQRMKNDLVAATPQGPKPRGPAFR